MQEGGAGKVLLHAIYLALLPEVWRAHHSHQGPGHPQQPAQGKNTLSAALKSSRRGTQIKQEDDAPRSNSAFLCWSSVEDYSLLP